MKDTFLEFSHFNVRSLCKSFDLFSSIVTESDLDVVGLSETWLTDAMPSYALNIPNYRFVRSDRGARGGGVAFYIENSLSFKLLATGGNNTQLEQMWVSLKVSGKNICLGTLYRPPNCNLGQCLDALEDQLVNLIPEFDYICFAGDFNVDFQKSNDNDFLQFSRLLSKYSLIQHVNQPTRVTANSSTLIDLMISTNKDSITSIGIMNMDNISDHYLIHCKLKFCNPKPKAFFKTYRDYSSFVYTDFLKDLNLIQWDYLFSLNDVNTMVNFFNYNVLELFNKHAPFITAKITKKPAPWLTPNLKLMIKLKKTSIH